MSGDIVNLEENTSRPTFLIVDSANILNGYIEYYGVKNAFFAFRAFLFDMIKKYSPDKTYIVVDRNQVKKYNYDREFLDLNKPDKGIFVESVPKADSKIYDHLDEIVETQSKQIDAEITVVIVTSDEDILGRLKYMKDNAKNVNFVVFYDEERSREKTIENLKEKGIEMHNIIIKRRYPPSIRPYKKIDLSPFNIELAYILLYLTERRNLEELKRIINNLLRARPKIREYIEKSINGRKNKSLYAADVDVQNAIIRYLIDNRMLFYGVQQEGESKELYFELKRSFRDTLRNLGF